MLDFLTSSVCHAFQCKELKMEKMQFFSQKGLKTQESGTIKSSSPVFLNNFSYNILIELSTTLIPEISSKNTNVPIVSYEIELFQKSGLAKCLS